jgi:23S rRNA (cytidine1920-2'-O)/16S rRNA (cytidine1409-2'-O)-methyltransferase
MKTRLDAELVRRGLARSRDVAVELIEGGKVLVTGIRATKAATQVDAQTSITLADEQSEYVSRGGHKLVGALDSFSQIDVKRKTALDAGASTGGFTDVLLKRGAAKVVAVDVGYGQLAWALQKDERVKILDRVNVRNLTPAQVGEEIDLVVADLSFISLKLVLPALISVAKEEADFLIMVKPQFEVGKEQLGAGGVVRDTFTLNLGCCGVVASSLPGPAGNVEYFLWLKKGAPALLEVDLDLAISKGPA